MIQIRDRVIQNRKGDQNWETVSQTRDRMIQTREILTQTRKIPTQPREFLIPATPSVPRSSLKAGCQQCPLNTGGLHIPSVFRHWHQQPGKEWTILRGKSSSGISLGQFDRKIPFHFKTPKSSRGVFIFHKGEIFTSQGSFHLNSLNNKIFGIKY